MGFERGGLILTAPKSQSLDNLQGISAISAVDAADSPPKVSGREGLVPARWERHTPEKNHSEHGA